MLSTLTSNCHLIDQGSPQIHLRLCPHMCIKSTATTTTCSNGIVIFIVICALHLIITFLHHWKLYKMTSQAVQARSLYRRLLRELPARTPSMLANPSPVQQHIRADFVSPTPATSPSESNDRASASFRGPHDSTGQSLQHQLQKPAERRLAEGDQYVHYLRSQRQYISLIERYNPGMNMKEEDRVRLTARRVGMDLPPEFMKDGGKAE